MHKTRQTLVEEFREWKRNRPDFPLTVHPAGQWSRRIKGKVRYFGALGDPDRALKLWLTEKDYLLAGVEPPTCAEGMTVGELLTAHLKDVDKRIEAGELSMWTRTHYRPLPAIFKAAGLFGMPVRLLAPGHFEKIKEVLVDSKLSLRSQATRIADIKAVFSWGADVAGTPKPNYGRFRPAKLELIEAEQEQSGRGRFLDRELILSILGAAKPALKVAVLLGINCGFYQGDTVEITLGNLHLDSDIPYHDFRRVKTKRPRMAVLWPETVEAIVDYRDNYRKPASEKERRLLLTGGKPYGPRGAQAMYGRFDRLVGDSEKRPAGAGLGSLRHTYATIVDSVPDQAMVDLTMGHARKGIRRKHYVQFNINELQRLKAVSDVARKWLYGEDS